MLDQWYVRPHKYIYMNINCVTDLPLIVYFHPNTTHRCRVLMRIRQTSLFTWFLDLYPKHKSITPPPLELSSTQTLVINAAGFLFMSTSLRHAVRRHNIIPFCLVVIGLNNGKTFVALAKTHLGARMVCHTHKYLHWRFDMRGDPSCRHHNILPICETRHVRVLMMCVQK